MANCSPNTDFPLLDSRGQQIRNIRFSNDRKTIEVLLNGNASPECTTNIDAAGFIGVKIENNNLVFTSAFSGLITDITASVSITNPTVAINLVSGVCIIGIDDISNGYSAPKMNVRYDAATNSVKFQI